MGTSRHRFPAEAVCPFPVISRTIPPWPAVAAHSQGSGETRSTPAGGTPDPRGVGGSQMDGPGARMRPTQPPGWPEGPLEVFRQRRDPQMADGRETSGGGTGFILVG